MIKAKRNCGSAIAAATAAFLIVFSATSARAQATGALGVRVGNGSALGTSGATVTVKELKGRTQTTTQTTGNNGRAEFTDLQPGNYEVTVEVDGKRGTSFVRVGTDRQEAPFDSRGLPRSGTSQSTAEELLNAVKAAAIACNRAAYDRAVEDLQREAALADSNVRDLTRMVDDYGRLSGYQPNLDQLRLTRDGILRSLQTGRRNANETVRAAGAGVDPGLIYLSGYIDALERLPKARERQRALAAALGQIPSFSKACINRLKLQIIMGEEIGLMLLNRPQLALFRTEIAGIIEQLGAFKPEHKDNAMRFGASIGTRFDAPFLGSGKQIGVELRGWYYDSTVKDGAEQIAPPGGGSIGLFSPTTMGNPFGGYSTMQNLNDVRYRGQYQSIGGEVQLQTWYRSGDLTIMPSLGLRLGHNDLDERISADIGVAFTTFDQKNTINDFFIGPTLGLRGRYQFSSGFYSFGGVSLGLDYHSAKGSWQTYVPLADAEPRRDKLSNSKLGLSAGVEFGVGWQLGGLSAQASLGAHHYTAAPYLKFTEADSTTTGTGGPEIGFGGLTEYQLKFGLQYRF